MKVVLIGGPPGAGKTTLGLTLAARLGFPSLTVDDLVVAVGAVTTEASHPALHQVRAVGFVDYFTRGPVAKLITDALTVEETMWPAVERVIASRIAHKGPIVMDWWLLSPARVKALANADVSSVWLHIDPTALEARERANTEFLADSPDPDTMLANFMHRSLWRNELVADQAADAGLPVLQITGRETPEDLATAAFDLIGSN